MKFTIKIISIMTALLGVLNQAYATTVKVTEHQGIEEYKLDNGLRIILAPLQNVKSVVVKMTYLTGSLNDPDGKSGLAHVLEHMAYKGTQGTSAVDFQQQFDQFTQNHLAITDYFSTSYISILNNEETLNQVLELEAQRMHQLQLKAEFLPAELELIQREYAISMDQPGTILRKQLFHSMYGSYDLGRIPIGDLEQLKTIQLEDIQQYYDTWYAPNNAALIIAGKFDPSQLLKNAEQYFSTIPKRPVPVSATMAPFQQQRIKQRQFSADKGKGYLQCHFYLNHAEETPQIVYALIPYLYSSEPNGKLFKDLVNKGIATDVFVDYWILPDHNQLLTLGAAYTPKHDAQKVRQALVQSAETPAKFTGLQFKRAVMQLDRNLKKYMTNANDLTNLIGDSLLIYGGEWQQFFSEKEQLGQIKAAVLNQQLSQIFVPEKRMQCELNPAPETLSSSTVPEKTTQPIEKNTDALMQDYVAAKKTEKNGVEANQIEANIAQETKMAERKLLKVTIQPATDINLIPVTTLSNTETNAVSNPSGNESPETVEPQAASDRTAEQTIEQKPALTNLSSGAIALAEPNKASVEVQSLEKKAEDADDSQNKVPALQQNEQTVNPVETSQDQKEVEE